ncbi:hypothetical protein V500_04717 [Pseudogymnoascus sp. VKM F-4518 (FW-2643)]|nr:hypothetical protein V500_04717 [Pseudogymnoascus sp. VKM F-4518 (FW-2643)]
MGSVNSPSDTSSEFSSLEGSHTTKLASENDYNATSAVKQPTGPEVFRFLDLPRELRDKIYGNLLIHHKPVELKFFKNGKDIEGIRSHIYETRLGMFPQICRTSKEVAWESFAVLYGDNSFHITSANEMALVDCHLGLRIYSHFIKSAVIDTFHLSFVEAVEKCTNPSSHFSIWQDTKLRTLSMTWVKGSLIIDCLKNVKTLCLNLPQSLEILTDDNKKAILDIKRNTPKDITVEFSGATPDIVSELSGAWPLHIPQKIVPQVIEKTVWKDPQPFKPLQWYTEQVERQRGQKNNYPLSTLASTCPTTLSTAIKRPPLDGYHTEEPPASKKQKPDENIPRYGSSPLSNPPNQIGKNELKANAEAQLLALDEMRLAAEEKSLASKEKILAEEKVALEKKKLALERDRFALEKKKLAVKDKKSPQSGIYGFNAMNKI